MAQFSLWTLQMLAFSLLVLDFSGAGATNSSSAISLGSGGCTVPESLLRDAFFAYRFVVENVSMTYMGTTTAKAMCRLKNYTQFCSSTDTIQPLSLDFVILSGPAAASDYVDAPDLQMYPVLGFAVVPIYNLGNVTGLVLSAQTLAQIFSGQIVTWDDDRIKNDNPSFATWGIPVNQSIELVVRAEACGSVMVLKQALASFDSGFAKKMDRSGNPTWSDLNVTMAEGIMGMTSYVMVTPYTIGYSTAGDAQSCSVQVAKLLYRGNTIVASSTRIEYSIMELGALFGNNGENPSHLTASIQGAVGNNTWPIAGYIYVGMRKTTRRPGTTCQNMAETVAFWQWFWTSDVATMLIHKHSMGSLPEAVRNTVLSRLSSDMVCDGTHVAAQDVQLQVTGYGPSSVTSLLERLLEIYTLVDSDMNATYTTLTTTQEATIPSLLSTSFWVSSHGTTSDNQLSLPLFAVGVVVISLFNVTLDLNTLALILEGNITSWLHPTLLALNPQGILDVYGNSISSSHQHITLLQGPEGALAVLEDILRKSAPWYTGAAIHRATQYSTDVVLQTAVLGIPSAFAVTTLSSNFGAVRIQTANIMRPGGEVVSPSWESIQACANDTVYDAIGRNLQLNTSSLSTCYPLAQALFLTITKEVCTTKTGTTRKHLVAFVEWLFGGVEMEAALEQQQVAPLMFATSSLEAMSAAALDYITCTPKVVATESSSSIILIVVLVCAAGGALVLFGVVAFWHSTRQMRKLRQQFSNDNVAQECAAAIARFDLDAVEWLKELKNPNRIQRSFMQIVHLLKEVKPFIPDQLLKSLMGEEEEEEAAEEAGDQGSEEASQKASPKGGSPSHSVIVVQSLHPISPLDKRDIVVASASSDSESETPRHPRMSPGRKPRRNSARSVASRSVANPLDECKWTRRRCAYMHIKVDGKLTMDSPAELADLAQAISSLVVVVKKHGATIDRVGIESIVVHWGLSSHVAEAAMKAVLAAMEVQQAAADTFASLKSQLWLSVGVGYGWCHVATLSTSGHRFYVSAGPEIKLATSIAHGEVARRCKCDVLMSSSVKQEVHFRVRCSPRAWVSKVLLWEPVTLAQECEADEWMYELQKMDEGSSTVAIANAMVAVFAMIPTSPPLGAVETAVSGLKARFGDALSAQDLACLDLLMASQSSQRLTTVDV